MDKQSLDNKFIVGVKFLGIFYFSWDEKRLTT